MKQFQMQGVGTLKPLSQSLLTLQCLVSAFSSIFPRRPFPHYTKRLVSHPPPIPLPTSPSPSLHMLAYALPPLQLFFEWSWRQLANETSFLLSFNQFLHLVASAISNPFLDPHIQKQVRDSSAKLRCNQPSHRHVLLTSLSYPSYLPSIVP